MELLAERMPWVIEVTVTVSQELVFLTRSLAGAKAPSKWWNLGGRKLEVIETGD